MLCFKPAAYVMLQTSMISGMMIKNNIRNNCEYRYKFYSQTEMEYLHSNDSDECVNLRSELIIKEWIFHKIHQNL